MGEREIFDSADLKVECYAGYRGEETPRRFHLGPRAVEVVDVLDRWQGPDYRYFKLRGDDGDTYILRHNERDGHWELTMLADSRYMAGRPPQGRGT